MLYIYAARYNHTLAALLYKSFLKMLSNYLHPHSIRVLNNPSNGIICSFQNEDPSSDKQHDIKSTCLSTVQLFYPFPIAHTYSVTIVVPL